MAGGAAHTTARAAALPIKRNGCGLLRLNRGVLARGQACALALCPRSVRTAILPAMHADVARVAWYRFRRTLRRRWGGYLALTLLLGLVGGLAMGSVAAARRTQAAFPAYLASTDPSDLTVLTGLNGVAG